MKKQPKKAREKFKQREKVLRELAKALDKCENNKVQIKLWHGIVVSKYGYVLPVGKGWAVRMLIPGTRDDDYPDLDLPLHQRIFPFHFKESCGVYVD